MKALGYAFNEALVSIRRAGRSAAMSIGTIAIAFLTLGGFLLLSTNLQSVVERWASAAEMSLYLAEDVAEDVRQQLIDELSAHPAVEQVEYVSKQAALERFRIDFPELADVTEGGGNPFPASLELRLRTDATATTAAEALASEMGARPGVSDVRYDRQWLSRLFALIGTIRLTGVAMAAVLILGAAFTVAAVVRLSLQARHEEIDIMQLVGAPFAFIRGPFVAEGTLLGGLGALVALALLWTIFVIMRPQLETAVAAWADTQALRFLTLGDVTTLLASGLGVGALAGWIASRSAR